VQQYSAGRHTYFAIAFGVMVLLLVVFIAWIVFFRHHGRAIHVSAHPAPIAKVKPGGSIAPIR
jgi:hypothetical protein